MTLELFEALARIGWIVVITLWLVSLNRRVETLEKEKK